jgi:formylglycine-generating enzyme required for sulfatase activity
MKILILASNPRKDLNIDREIRDLREVIKRSRNRQDFEVADALAVRVSDLQELLLEHQPQIVHFCGHGGGEQGLVFETAEGTGEQWVQTEALSELFRLCASHVQCALLNSCYSETQAEAIVNHIDYVIGMNREIRDDAAIAFSKGFYRALGYESSIEEAFEFGKNAIQLEISGSSRVRSASTDEARKLEVVDTIQKVTLPEHLKPVLKVNPALLEKLAAQPNQTGRVISEEERTAIQIDIDKVLEADEKLRQYRERVQEYLSDRKLTTLEKLRLDRLRKTLGIPETDAQRILAEEQNPMQAAQQEYAELLTGLMVDEGHYPLDADTKAELQALQQELDLTDHEVRMISQPIVAQAETAYMQCISPDLGDGLRLELVRIPGGAFLMGSPEDEGENTERPQHSVTVPEFFMGKYAVTQAQWRTVAALPQVSRSLTAEPSQFKGDNRPVEKVSWHDAIEFCDRLTRLTGQRYRLPSEAEWEYACRAKTTTAFHFGTDLTPDLANYGKNRGTTTDVGSFPPNGFGLYDMHGNLWEWCADYWHENYTAAPDDGSAWIAGGESEYRIRRGGSWGFDPVGCRSAFRGRSAPGGIFNSVGFRVVCGGA